MGQELQVRTVENAIPNTALIKGYPEGSDITLLNATLFRGKPDENGKWSDDVMTLVFRDNISGEKHKIEIENPDNDYYLIKPEYQTDYNQLFVPIEETDHFICPNKSLTREIAKATGNYDFYQENVSNGNGRANAILHTDPRVMFSDMALEDKYRYYFGQVYQNNIYPISKCFLDIEADTIHMAGDFPELGECPVNAVTLVMQNCKTIFTLLLRDPDNEQANNFEIAYNNGEITPQLREFIKENVGGEKAFHNFGLDEYEYQLLFYDVEINLIVDVFRLINQFKPDFVLAWNMAFDIPYLEARIRVLGYDPAEIMCHPDFKRKEVRYFIDERVKNEYAERGDFCNIASYSVFLDQMIHFASRRKGQSQFTSFSLDFIGGVIAKVRKLDYKHITSHLSELPRKNYLVFVFYNIFDTIVQHCTESVVQDIDYVFAKCLQNNTRYNKCHRQTVYLTNRGAKEFMKDGFVMGNNANRGSDPPTTKFPGAFVANPKKLNDYSKQRIAGMPVYVFDNLDDFDYKSLYPSILREFNIAPNTQIGQLQLPDKIHDKENRILDSKWLRAGEFMEDLQSHVWIEFCARWFHMAGYEELYDDIIYYYTNIEMPRYPLRPYDYNGMLVPIEFFGDDVEYVQDDGIRQKYDYDNHEMMVPIVYFPEYPEEEAKEFIIHATNVPNQKFTIKED